MNWKLLGIAFLMTLSFFILMSGLSVLFDKEPLTLLVVLFLLALFFIYKSMKNDLDTDD